MAIKHDNCKKCRSRCIHAGKDRDFVCINGVSCKITTGKLQTNAVTVQEWISVEDRLPEDQEEVLVCTRSKNGIRNIDKGYMAIDRFIHRGRAEVTHWMPLPKPPKGE